MPKQCCVRETEFTENNQQVYRVYLARSVPSAQSGPSLTVLSLWKGPGGLPTPSYSTALSFSPHLGCAHSAGPQPAAQVAHPNWCPFSAPQGQAYGALAHSSGSQLGLRGPCVPFLLGKQSVLLTTGNTHTHTHTFCFWDSSSPLSPYLGPSCPKVSVFSLPGTCFPGFLRAYDCGQAIFSLSWNVSPRCRLLN